jgi:transposase-like protein
LVNHRIPRQPAQKRRFWLDIIRGHAASGLSIEAWCRQNEVSTSVFYAWKKQLSGQIGLGSPSSEQPRFVEVLVQNQPISEPVGPKANLLIHLGRACIEIPAGFDSATIRVVLETLRGEPC